MLTLPYGFNSDLPDMEEARSPMRALPLPEPAPDEPVAEPTAPGPVVAAPTRKAEPFAALSALKRRSTRQGEPKNWEVRR